MKAIVMKDYGDVDTLELAEVEEPRPGAGELKVRVVVAGINPVDWKLRSGALRSRMPLELPAILGRDVAGEVVELGAGVTAFEPGDRVMGLVREGYAEYVVAPREAWAKLPDDLDLATAGALPLVGLTGRELAEEAIDARPGEVVLVTGAVGAVGRMTVFSAKRRGAIVIAGVRAYQREAACELGADGVVALDDAEEVAHLPQLDAVADTVDGDTITHVLARLKPGGTIGSVVGEPPHAEERGFHVRSLLAHPDSARLEELGRDAAAGAFSLPIEQTFPLVDARHAQRLAAQRGVGKVLLMP